MVGVTGHACEPSFAQPEIAINLFETGVSAATGAFSAIVARAPTAAIKSFMGS